MQNSIHHDAMDPSSSFKQPLPPLPSTIRNPYLNSRPPTPTLGEVARSDVNVTSDAEAKPEVPLGRQEDRTSPVEEKKEDEDATTNTGRNPNTGLAYWERLPSKNLSQVSAEILTVDECVKHCLLYLGRSVRVTGQLHQRTFVGDDVETPRQVLLELIDPIPMVTQQASKYQYNASGTATPANDAAIAHTTPGKSVPPSTATKTSLYTVKTPFKTPLKTLGPARRPGSSSSTLLLGNSSTKTPGYSLSEKRKRPWFATTTSNSASARKKPPPKTAPRLLLKVLVDPALPGLDTIAPSGASKVMVLGVILESGWMQAQFVSLVAPTTDMNLYLTALQTRRRYLYQHRYNHNMTSLAERRESSSSTADVVESTATGAAAAILLLLGCGPPPYKDLEKNQTE